MYLFHKPSGTTQRYRRLISDYIRAIVRTMHYSEYIKKTIESFLNLGKRSHPLDVISLQNLLKNIKIERINNWFMVNDQLDAQFFSMYLFQSSTYFEQPCAHHQVPFRPAHETVTGTEWYTPDVVLIQLILLMMSTRLLEKCRELK